MGLPLVSLCARRLKGDHGFQGPDAVRRETNRRAFKGPACGGGAE